ncbi:MAG: bifunctional 5,10-methylene-tetrahydrofolate dehydrogenase/5,10-methylene-tetrahydrofolate cyclohydrolase [Prevotellaceae bacterium]|jgi:methylenetetrahydrofolate dehydrogenase (NADP+)/methenyltetrahydrofolate cyclohydrolase|nr:bifunctional 5,10-methylene-tetrahydrofolate dehydrogenase/5,10-methylene-tetrahydrofolate cyclohydrolase [Prevotellaceae bacterium]
MTILDGKATAEALKKEIAQTVQQWKKDGKKTPHLAAILVGCDGASETYVNSKERDCHEVGMQSTVIRLPDTITEAELLQKVNDINRNDDIDGLIVQLPLPKHIDEQKIIEAIDPKKDVDGFHPLNVGRMVAGLPSYISATPDGIIELLARYRIETAGKHVVVIGRSNIVGRPVANLLSLKANPGNCTVTLCHSQTNNLKSLCLQSDIIIAALGKPEFLTGDMVRENAIVIDVGITRVKAATKNGFRLAGDVKFNEVAPKCSYITPVPGGIGPMTRASLLKNTLKAASKEVFA